MINIERERKKEEKKNSEKQLKGERKKSNSSLMSNSNRIEEITGSLVYKLHECLINCVAREETVSSFISAYKFVLFESVSIDTYV